MLFTTKDLKKLIQQDYNYHATHLSKSGILLYPNTVPLKLKTQTIEVTIRDCNLQPNNCWWNAYEMATKELLDVAIVYLIDEFPFRHGVLHFINYDCHCDQYVDCTPLTSNSDKPSYVRLGQFGCFDSALNDINGAINSIQDLNKVLKSFFKEQYLP